MKALVLIVSVLTLAACVKYIPQVKIVEEPMLQSCEYIETISETMDTGRLWQHLLPCDPQYEVLRRADNLRATHLVWVYDYGIGSAAIAYRCDP